MTFVPFALEEWQSRFETTVEFNLADSGVQPVTLQELVGDPDEVERLLALELHYPPVGGTEKLRALIADWQGGSAEDVLVTVGAAEANSLTIASLIDPGDHVVVMEPGYRQVWGCALNAGATVDAFPLNPATAWRPELETLAAVVTPQTKLIAVTNPNNPVGTILTEQEMKAIVTAADGVGAWILADEVYRGSERVSELVTPSFLQLYDRVVCVGSLSKAFGLPGLRLGWLAAPQHVRDLAWRHHEYVTIATGVLSMHLAELALRPDVREKLLERNRALIRTGYARLQDWIDGSDGLLSIVPPAATALGFVRYHFDTASLRVADVLRTEADVLVGAGAHFGIEHHLRLTHGLSPEYLDEALRRIGASLLLQSRATALR